MEKIIILGKSYEAISEASPHNCSGCSFEESNGDCGVPHLLGELSCTFKKVIFREYKLEEQPTPTVKPTIQMNLELDLSNCTLPVFFTVKNLRLVSLDTALKNQSDAYNISVKDLPQETIEMLAEALKAEFIKRNTKVIT